MSVVRYVSEVIHTRCVESSDNCILSVDIFLFYYAETLLPEAPNPPRETLVLVDADDLVIDFAPLLATVGLLPDLEV